MLISAAADERIARACVCANETCCVRVRTPTASRTVRGQPSAAQTYVCQKKQHFSQASRRTGVSRGVPSLSLSLRPSAISLRANVFTTFGPNLHRFFRDGETQLIFFPKNNNKNSSLKKTNKNNKYVQTIPKNNNVVAIFR